MVTIKIKRVYEPSEKSDGYRVLVDRLWPRGLKKETANIDQWMKEVGPSASLRKWFDHDAEKWTQFIARYKIELKGSAAYEELIAAVKKHKIITLLYGAKNEEYNQAVALKKFLQD